MMHIPMSFLDVDKNTGCQKMTEIEAENFAFAMMYDISRNVKFSSNEELDKFFLLQVMTRRLPERVEVSLYAAIFLSTLCDSPGKAVMWAYAITRLYDKIGKMVSMEHIVTEFPNGFPTNNVISTCWEDQKAYKHGQEGDNILDQLYPWERQ